MSDTVPTTPDVLGSDITEIAEPQVTADQDPTNADTVAAVIDPNAVVTVTVTAQALLADLCAELRLQVRGISHRIEGLLAKAADHFGV